MRRFVLTVLAFTLLAGLAFAQDGGPFQADRFVEDKWKVVGGEYVDDFGYESHIEFLAFMPSAMHGGLEVAVEAYIGRDGNARPAVYMGFVGRVGATASTRIRYEDGRGKAVTLVLDDRAVVEKGGFPLGVHASERLVGLLLDGRDVDVRIDFDDGSHFLFGLDAEGFAGLYRKLAATAE